MLPREVPPLNERQWKFVEKCLSNPPSKLAQERLKEAIKNAKNIKSSK